MSLAGINMAKRFCETCVVVTSERQVELVEHQVKEVETTIAKLMQQEPQYFTSIKDIGPIIVPTLLVVMDIHCFSPPEKSGSPCQY